MNYRTLFTKNYNLNLEYENDCINLEIITLKKKFTGQINEPINGIDLLDLFNNLNKDDIEFKNGILKIIVQYNYKDKVYKHEIIKNLKMELLKLDLSVLNATFILPYKYSLVFGTGLQNAIKLDQIFSHGMHKFSYTTNHTSNSDCSSNCPYFSGKIIKFKYPEIRATYFKFNIQIIPGWVFSLQSGLKKIIIHRMFQYVWLPIGEFIELEILEHKDDRRCISEIYFEIDGYL